jgi:hypothetical protein
MRACLKGGRGMSNSSCVELALCMDCLDERVSCQPHPTCIDRPRRGSLRKGSGKSCTSCMVGALSTPIKQIHH